MRLLLDRARLHRPARRSHHHRHPRWRVASPHGPAGLISREQVILDWTRKASIPVHDLATPKPARGAHGALKVNKDESWATESYFRRRRGVLPNYLTYLVTEGVLDFHALDKLNKTEKKPSKAVVSVDSAVVFARPRA